jgi:hypothetical protein
MTLTELERRARITYLLARLKKHPAGDGIGMAELVAEIIELHNSRPRRRVGDACIQGWTYIEPHGMRQGRDWEGSQP